MHTNGEFWLATTPEVRSRGFLRWEGGEWHLETETPLFWSASLRPLPGGGTMRVTGSPVALAKDTAPRLLLGDLDDGERLTVLGAQSDGVVGLRDVGPRKWSGYSMLMGAHVLEGKRALVQEVRWSLPRVGADWQAGEVRECESGVLEVVRQEECLGLALKLAYPAEVTTAATVPGRITNLLSLMARKRVIFADVQLKLEDGSWLRETAGKPDLSKRPEHSRITVDDLVRWDAVSRKAGPLPYIALDSGSVLLQVHAQVLATALEGAHSRLYADVTALESLGQKPRRRVAKKLTDATLEALEKEGIVAPEAYRDRFREAWGGLGKPSYRERLRELLSQVEGVIPGLFGPSLDEWIELVSKVRNVQSHQLPEHDDFGDNYVSNYLAIVLASRLALRVAVLLPLLGEERLKRELDLFVCLDVLAHLDAEGLWTGFSSVRRFTASRRLDHIAADGVCAD